MTMQELLKFARIYHTDIEGVSIDLRIGDRRLAFEGMADDIRVYPSDVAQAVAGDRALTTSQVPDWFRWLSGVGEIPE